MRLHLHFSASVGPISLPISSKGFASKQTTPFPGKEAWMGMVPPGFHQCHCWCQPEMLTEKLQEVFTTPLGAEHARSAWPRDRGLMSPYLINRKCTCHLLPSWIQRESWGQAKLCCEMDGTFTLLSIHSMWYSLNPECNSSASLSYLSQANCIQCDIVSSSSSKGGYEVECICYTYVGQPNPT